jgi:hypothetical protein
VLKIEVEQSQFIETTPGPDLSQKLDEAVNQDKSRRVSTVCDLDLCQDRIFIEDLDTGQTHEFQFAGRLRWRPITDINWLDNHILAFTQWSQPGYGFRYAIDVDEQEVLLVVHMTNECFAYGKCDR